MDTIIFTVYAIMAAGAIIGIAGTFLGIALGKIEV